MSINSSSTATEPYMYMGHGTAPKNVTDVIVHKSVTVIPKCAFKECYDLKSAILPEGLLEIAEEAFDDCTSLEDINFPMSLRIIGKSAFSNCLSLTRADLNEGLQTIGAAAFSECESIIYLKIPSTVITIENGAFQECWALKDVQLCEGLQTIGVNTFRNCHSLLRINIPSSVTNIESMSFYYCYLLRNMSENVPDSDMTSFFLSSVGEVLDEEDREDLLRDRFRDLPLHRICFYQTESQTLLEEVKEHATKESLAQVDCLGMTPLHILACSGWYDDSVELYNFFVGEYPEALLIKDKWGETPLAYAILSEAPQEIIHFLMGRHSKSLTGSLPFDFSSMVERLAKKEGTNAEFLRSIIRAQRTHFPTLEIEWERLVVVAENVEGKMHADMFGVLVEASISNFNRMSSGHRIAMDNLINGMIKADLRWERESRDQVRDLVVTSVQQYREFLKEATTMTELALWQVAIDELKYDQGSDNEGKHCKKRAKIDNAEFRKNCRVKCKAKDTIPLILSFL